MSDEFVAYTRPLTAEEIATLKRDVQTHEPVRTLLYTSPVERKQARMSLNVPLSVLCEILELTEDEYLAFENDPQLVSSEANESFRRLMNAVLFADAIRTPERSGSYPKPLVDRWEAEKAAALARRPTNPLKVPDTDLYEVS